MKPRARVALIGTSLLLTACVTATAAAAFQVQIGSPTPLTGPVSGTRIDVVLKNGSRGVAKRVVVRCQFFGSDGEAVETGTAYFNNLGAGQSDTNTLLLTHPDVARGDCIAR